MIILMRCSEAGAVHFHGSQDIKQVIYFFAYVFTNMREIWHKDSVMRK